MPLIEKTKLNTLAWKASWFEQAKITNPVDGCKTALFQVFKTTNPADWINRAGVNFLVGVEEANDNVPDASKGMWLRGATMWSYLVNYQTKIPPRYHSGSLQAPNTTYSPSFNPSDTPYELTFKQGYCVAEFLPLIGFFGNEFVGEGYLRENGWQTSADHVSDFEKGVVTRLKERFAAANKSMYFSCQYGAFYTFQHRMKGGWRLNDGTVASPTNSFFKSLLQSRSAARAACRFFSENLDEMGMAHTLKFYQENFQARHDFYLFLYILRVAVFGTLQDNGVPRNRILMLFWAKVEQLNDGLAWALHNGFYYRRRIDSKGGTVVTTEHPQEDHEKMYAMCLFAMATGVIPAGYSIGDVFHWENSQIFGTDAQYMTSLNPSPTPDRANYVNWVPDASQPAPVSADGFPESPMGYMDICPKAKIDYQTTINTAGQPWPDLRYKCVERLTDAGWQTVNEGWVEPVSDGTTVLDWAAMYDGANATPGPGKVRGGLCAIHREKVSGGQRHVSIIWYHPGRGPMSKEKYLVQTNSGKQLYITVQGAVAEVFNESYPI